MALVNDRVKVTTIERDMDRYVVALNNIEKFNLSDRINIILGDALEVSLSDKYDMIFIDAAKAQYIKFFERYSDNLKEGGFIISDNLSFHGLVLDETKINNRNTKQLVGKIKKYIEHLKNNDKYDTTFYTLGDGVSVSTKKVQ